MVVRARADVRMQNNRPLTFEVFVCCVLQLHVVTCPFKHVAFESGCTAGSRRGLVQGNSWGEYQAIYFTDSVAAMRAFPWFLKCARDKLSS